MRAFIPSKFHFFSGFLSVHLLLTPDRRSQTLWSNPATSVGAWTRYLNGLWPCLADFRFIIHIGCDKTNSVTEQFKALKFSVDLFFWYTTFAVYVVRYWSTYVYMIVYHVTKSLLPMSSNTLMGTMIAMHTVFFHKLHLISNFGAWCCYKGTNGILHRTWE